MRLNKKIRTFFLFIVFLTTISGLLIPDISLIISQIQKENNIVDKIYLAKQNKNVIDNFRVYAATDPGELEYTVDIGPITGSASANYVYASFFNPAASGKTAVIKHIAIRANAVAASSYVYLTIRRTSTASSGTQITGENIPRKNNDSSNSILDVRHTGATVTFSGITNSRILSQTTPGAAGQYHSIRDIKFETNDEKIILQPGEGIALYQEAASDTDQRIRAHIEWEEVADTPTAQNEFLFTYPGVAVNATTNYVYNSFFNPAASGKTAIIKRIGFGTDTANGTATTYQNISLRRISSASAGSTITATNVPKKNTGSANSVMDFRHTNVTVGLVGGSDYRLGMVTPGTTGSASGWQEINIHSNDEQIILQPGEGIALISEAAGDPNQLARMIIEWQEVAYASTPTSQGEYILALPRITASSAPVLDTTFYTFFNPAASGKTAVIKRLVIRNNADTTATYSSFNFRRISAASNGTQITATDVPKKHTGTANSVTEIRHCGTACTTAITATYTGSSDSRLIAVNGPGTAAQNIGHREIVFGDNEKLILQPGEGIGFYLDVLAGDIDHYIKVSIEWDEESLTPSSQGEYLINIGPVAGSTTSEYKYATFFNPAASGKTAIIKRIELRIDTIAAAKYIPVTIRRISAASGGTQITATNIPKKHTGTVDSAMDIRRTGVTATLTGTSDSRLTSVQTPGAVGTVIAPSLTGYKDLIFQNEENIILQPGEGLVVYQEASGDADFRVKTLFEWQEVTYANTPTSQGEYLMTLGPVTGSLTSEYKYATFFNPITSNKDYIIKRLEIKANRNNTLTAPGYIPVTIRRISAASGGTQITATNIPKKHTGTANTTAEIRYAGVTATLDGITDTRLLGVTIPGAVNQFYGDYEDIIVYQDELILRPGQGLVLYQEATAGDTYVNFRFNFEWNEVTSTTPVVSITINDGAIDYGMVSPSGSKTTLDISDSQIITNAGNTREDFDIKGLATTTGGTCTHWSILGSGTPGANQYAHEWSINAGSLWTRFTDTYSEFSSNVAIGGTTTLDLKLIMPSSSNCLDTQNVDITIQASAH